jgi:hypothetical protein
MRHLIDAQSLIWYVDHDHLLSPAAHAAITDPTTSAGRANADHQRGSLTRSIWRRSDLAVRSL